MQEYYELFNAHGSRSVPIFTSILVDIEMQVDICADLGLNSAFTLSDLALKYPGAAGTTTTPQGILPDSVLATNRTSDGLLNETFLTTYVNTLTDQNRIPKPPSPERGVATPGTSVKSYMDAEKEFMNQFKAEYCFYHARYKYALEQLITKIGDTYAAHSDAKALEVDQWVGVSRDLNQKLNDLVQIANAITTKRFNQAREGNTNVNDINDQLAERSTALQEQAKILNDKNAKSELYKRMMDYTQSKAKVSNNLLQLYGALNVVALGMLFYIYRAT